LSLAAAPRRGGEAELNMKKFILLSVISILVIAAGGFFWWWQSREIKGSPSDYVIKETEAGKIVENKRAGLTVKVPEGWEVKKVELLEGSVVFNTPDIEGAWRNEMISPPLGKGCLIETSLIYKKINFDQIKEEVRDIHLGLGIQSEEFENIMINNQQVLKNIFESEILGPATAVYITKKNRLYDFDLYWALEDKERCIQDFNKFLETISIK